MIGEPLLGELVELVEEDEVVDTIDDVADPDEVVDDDDLLAVVVVVETIEVEVRVDVADKVEVEDVVDAVEVEVTVEVVEEVEVEDVEVEDVLVVVPITRIPFWIDTDVDWIAYWLMLPCTASVEVTVPFRTTV